MDDLPKPPATPYREGKPLAEIIPPDRRRLKLVAIVAASMLAGIVLWTSGGALLGSMCTSRNRTAPIVNGYVAGRIAPAVLHGPAGKDVVMPPQQLSIVHVWLQNCADCMPAFEAMRRLQDDGGLGVDVPIVNVAYGEADPSWAARYGVSTNLVFDLNGTSVVRPLGISSFTTLVIDKTGTILLRDRPDRPGYRMRVRAAVHAEDPREPAPTNVLDAHTVQRVVDAHRGVVAACWHHREQQDGVAPATASVNLRATIGADGTVTSTSTTYKSGIPTGLTDPRVSDDQGDSRIPAVAAVSQCLEQQVSTWRFPAAPERAAVTVNIPFQFVRE